MRSHDQLKTKNISCCARPMATKLVRVLTYDHGYSQHFSTTLWPRSQVRSSGVNISYSRKPVTSKLNRAVTYNEQNSPMMSNCHLFFQKVFDHKPLQRCHLWRGKINYNVTWLSEHLGQVKEWKRNTFLEQRLWLSI